MDKITLSNIDEYIAQFPMEIREKLEIIRATIQKAAPGATETISYQMPCFKFNGVLVYFAAFKNHIGFFPTASGVEKFKKEIAGYKTTKGTIQFPLNQPIPLDLVTRIVEFRVKENQEKAQKKKMSNRKTK